MLHSQSVQQKTFNLSSESLVLINGSNLREAGARAPEVNDTRFTFHGDPPQGGDTFLRTGATIPVTNSIFAFRNNGHFGR